MQDRSQILEGSLWKSVLLFSIPVALTSILEQLSSVIDVVMIGNFASETGMAAVGSNTPIMQLVINLFVGISLGANVVIAHAIGKGDQDTVQRATHTSIAITGLGIIAAIVLELLAQPLLTLLSVPADTMPEAITFLRVYLIGLPFILLYNFEAAILRSAGQTRPPLQALLISSVLNVGLDIILVPILHLGVGGCAMGTTFCYITSSAMLFWRLTHTDAPVRVTPSQIGFDRAALIRILRIGLPAGVQSAVFALANIIIQAAINSLGSAVIAASSAALSIECVCYVTMNSFSQACTTFVGQNFGARKIERCKKTLKVCLIEDGLVVIAFTLVAVGLGRWLLSLFNPDPNVVSIGYIRVCSIIPSYIFSMAYENVSGYLRGFGISTLPAAITIASICGIRVFWVAMVFPHDPTFSCIMTVYPVSLGATAALVSLAALITRPAKTLGRAGSRKIAK